MSTCLEFDLSVPLPQIPDIFKGTALSATIKLGTIGVTCCSYTLPTLTATIPLPMIGPLQAAIAVINATIGSQLHVLDSIFIPRCPI